MFLVVEVEEDQEKARPQVDAYRLLLSNLRKNGVKLDVCKPGANYRVLCPKCDGGSTSEKCLSVIIFEDKEESSQASIVQGGPLAFFKCHRGKCGWNGRVGAYKPFMENFAEKKYTPESPTKPQKRKITVEELKLQPLCMELITYFRERGISQETLKRNGVMQKDENQLAIAFTYKRHGELVSCKYRDIEKRFWQVGYILLFGLSCAMLLLTCLCFSLESGSTYAAKLGFLCAGWKPKAMPNLSSWIGMLLNHGINGLLVIMSLRDTAI
ncbi:hypothetical protein GIB67_028444 [Kingdonia uniflora]|uniref:Uncharacterized protein n=1 Tax=Kingdonia uniflora TaxID=39325 RepID=A0A7J7P129_9MAGN|nr:hypothetical protein GIB67_028444 [Kingdonia uniflora]